MAERELNAGEKHMLRLCAAEADAEGWAKVSSVVFPLLEKMPAGLLELERAGSEGAGKARLTQTGRNILNSMAWLGA